MIQAHDIPPGMSDAKAVRDNAGVIARATRMLEMWDRVLNALVIKPGRALEELNSDWTASQEIADLLMRKYKLSFRAEHHFASEIVESARAQAIRPSDFPYAEVRRIYGETLYEMALPPEELPMSEAEFRATLDPLGDRARPCDLGRAPAGGHDANAECG